MRHNPSIIVSLLFAIVICYLYIDQSAALWYHDSLPPYFHRLFKSLTEFGDSIYYLVGFLLSFVFFRYGVRNPYWANRSLFFLATIAVSGIAVNVIKVFIGRYRPRELFDQGLYGFDFFHYGYAMTSFPSGHTTTVFALAAAIAYLWPKWTFPVSIWAMLVGISRIALNAHYPSDVIAGAAVGVVSTLVLISYWNHSYGYNQKPFFYSGKGRRESVTL